MSRAVTPPIRPDLCCQYCFGPKPLPPPLRPGQIPYHWGQSVDVRDIYHRAESGSCSGCSLFQKLIHQAERSIEDKVETIRFEPPLSPGYHACILLIQRHGGIHEMTFGFDTVSRLKPEWAALGDWSPREHQLFSRLAQGWVDQCFSNHERCRRPTLTPLPRRVIDVGHREAFLYETRGETGRYATLSHCWQDSQPLKTMRSTLESRLGRLIWSQLPLAFQECIEIVRSLGIRFLWIDSLCILQDDSKEWEVEAARMASIFENSYLTIAMHQPQPNASSLYSPDEVTDSLELIVPVVFQRSLQPKMRPQRLTLDQRKVQFRIRSLSQEARYDIERGHLSKRGWCFQERLLANRILHCTPSELLFECSESRLCECSEAHQGLNQDAHFSSTNWKAVFAEDSVTNAEWQELITMYTQTDLTFPKDTLPALSGIANRVRNGGRYYAGMWENSLEHSLLWYSTVEEGRWPRRPESYVAPSFAWPSVIGNKAFVDCSTLDAKLKVVSVNCSTTGDNSIGELNGGCIQLKAAYLRAVFANAFDGSIKASTFFISDKHGGFCLYATLRCGAGKYYIFYLDAQDDMNLIAGTDLWCLELFAGKTLDWPCHGLVIRKIRPDEASFSPDSLRFRRVGVFGSIRGLHFTGSRTAKFNIW